MNHLHGSLTHRTNGQRAEEEGNHSAHKQHGQDVGLVDVDAVNACQAHVGGKQSQSSQGRRGNGKAFTCCSRSIAHCVKVVGALANLARQMTHLGDSAGVVGDGTKGVNSQLHCRGRHHACCCNSDPIKPGKRKRTIDSRGQNKNGQNRRLHAHGKAADDVGSVPRTRPLHDAVHGAATD